MLGLGCVAGCWYRLSVYVAGEGLATFAQERATRGAMIQSTAREQVESLVLNKLLIASSLGGIRRSAR